MTIFFELCALYIHRMPAKRTRFSHFHRSIIASRQSWACQACGTMFGPLWHVDHIVPLWRDGSNDFSNLQALCETCHAVKSSCESTQRAETKAEDDARPRKRQRIQAPTSGDH
jgi:5-methylcytosine-specific restriction endonuclease McrA